MAEPRKSLEPFLRDDVEYYKHQVDGVRQMVPMDSFLLADDMGLGKSLQALTVFCIDVKLGKGDTLIIVCPVSLRDNWADEIEKFTRLPYTLLGQVADPRKHGQLKTVAPKAREKQLEEFMLQTGPRILICNYEQIAPHQILFNSFRFHMGIFDEAHMMKNHKAKRTQAALGIKSLRSGMLTGTPMLNQVDELWTLLHRIDPRAFPKYWTFVNRYCVFGGYENRQIIGVKNEAELKKLLGKVMIRRLKKNVLSRDEPTYIRHMVGLSPEQRKLYDQIEEELFLTDPATGEPLDVENALTKFLRLKQICNTPYSINASFPDDSFKLDRVTEVTSELMDQDHKFILFSQFRGTIEAQVNRLHRAKLGPVFQLHGDVPKNLRQGTVSEWSRVTGGAIIVCQTAVAGVGLNMTASSNVGFIDKLFVPGLNKQAVDRADRIGQTEPVMVHEFLTRGTVESRIEAILKAKGDLGEEIIGGSMGIRKLLEMLRQRMTEE
jgi:SNF2 family DNA or RNA helicase